MKSTSSHPLYTIDEIDREIILALKNDGRTPFAQIAEALGVSAGMIRQRFKRMKEEGLLKVVASTNPMLMGYQSMALIGVKADVRRIEEIARQIAQYEEVIYLVICTGTYDLILEVVCQDNDHLLEFLTQKLYAVNGVRETDTFTYLKTIKEVYTIPPKEVSPVSDSIPSAPSS
jgi:Lrp/AsnC family transcriptional regulator for asnA, asnC and gidA